MGMFRKVCSTNPYANAPDPKNFVVEDVVSHGDYHLLVVIYPDATNFEGRKLLIVYATVGELVALQQLDPHFSDDGFVIARFHPARRALAEQFLFTLG